MADDRDRKYRQPGYRSSEPERRQPPPTRPPSARRGFDTLFKR